MAPRESAPVNVTNQRHPPDRHFLACRRSPSWVTRYIPRRSRHVSNVPKSRNRGCKPLWKTSTRGPLQAPPTIFLVEALAQSCLGNHICPGAVSDRRGGPKGGRCIKTSDVHPFFHDRARL